ncbi:unnamed protein product [Vicia faba]|uniref:RRM domain-containing protein n=1 Tax=Vicia faba TaxID=3906 RepID=A0AAV0YSE7_VICFA|nr:unnamed protein product [Vicia faba]
MLNSIVGSSLNDLIEYVNSMKPELLESDVTSLLKGLDLSRNWERAFLLFEWVWLNFGSKNVKVNNQSVELTVKILGRESQYSISSKLFDIIHVEEFSLDVRACTTVLHAYARTEKYKRAIEIFEKMKETGLNPTLVTYNVMLDVYGKMGRSWNIILELLDEMKSKGLEFDEFMCSTVNRLVRKSSPPLKPPDIILSQSPQPSDVVREAKSNFDCVIEVDDGSHVEASVDHYIDSEIDDSVSDTNVEFNNTLSTTKFNNVYVKKLSEVVIDDDLKSIFGEYGTITSVVVRRDVDGKLKCFGFVNFENADAAAKDVKALIGKKLYENECYVGKALKKY